MLNWIIDKPVIYMSHSIRGKYGEESTIETENDNCRKAHLAAQKIQSIFSGISLYVPGECEILTRVLKKHGNLCTKQILDADCEILSYCDGWMYYKFGVSKGCDYEKIAAKKLGFLFNSKIQVINFNIEEASIEIIRKKIGPIIKFAVNTYNHRKHGGG
jgi:hypothetical protein